MSSPVGMRGCLLEAPDIVKSFGQTPLLLNRMTSPNNARVG